MWKQNYEQFKNKDFLPICESDDNVFRGGVEFTVIHSQNQINECGPYRHAQIDSGVGLIDEQHTITSINLDCLNQSTDHLLGGMTTVGDTTIAQGDGNYVHRPSLRNFTNSAPCVPEHTMNMDALMVVF